MSHGERLTTRRRALRWSGHIGVGLLVAVACAAMVLVNAIVALSVAGAGTPGESARGSGHDAEWLGHAWVDGRRTQSDVDTLASRLRGTGIRDLFVHAGPFNDDGTLDPALRPRAAWVIRALHTALPGVRVQAWLGAHPVPAEFQLNSATSRAAVLRSVGQVLDDGFDGVHLDFEPLADGDPDLLTLLGAAHELTKARGVVLSVSATRSEPWSGVAAIITALPGNLPVWSGGYLHRVALLVDQVAVMAYDSGLPTRSSYLGYVRRSTQVALAAVPPAVTLLIGIPAYHEESTYHHVGAETMPVALRGVRLALGGQPAGRQIGVAVYIDFTVTEPDWAAYERDWARGTD